MKTLIENKRYDEERALYGSAHLTLKNVSFDGPADGESALKESKDICAEHCYCNLRYPFWHVDGLTLTDCDMTELCRAAVWYSNDIKITNTKMHGIKALRECSRVKVSHSDIISPEFGWSVNGVEMENCTVESEYFLLRSKDIKLKKVNFSGKYSFQYTENVEIVNCDFKTKDAFWHGKNIVIKDSVIKGEYLAWYSDGLTLINCTVVGTQPFCYCKNLKLINCKMLEADLCFEKSQVEAHITTPVLSVKNPVSGTITAPEIGEIIMTDENSTCKILTNQTRTA